MADRILIPATVALLDGWCGPVVWDDREWACVAVWDTPDGWVVALAPLGNASVLATPVHDDLYRVSLDLSRAEVRDRVARRLLVGDETATAPAWGRHAQRWVLIEDSGVLSREFWPRHARFEAGDTLVPALADLDPDDDTRLPDGSRRVDALALQAVWLEVSRG